MHATMSLSPSLISRHANSAKGPFTFHFSLSLCENATARPLLVRLILDVGRGLKKTNADILTRGLITHNAFRRMSEKSILISVLSLLSGERDALKAWGSQVHSGGLKKIPRQKMSRAPKKIDASLVHKYDFFLLPLDFILVV